MQLRALAVVLVLGACATTPGADDVDRDRAFGLDEGKGFVLTLRADDPVVREGDEITVIATIASPGGDALIMGSPSGIVGFSVTRIEDGLTSGPPGWRAACQEYTVPAEPMEIPFAKSGGWGADDPDADFLRTYFADSALTLPAGTWRIDAITNGNIGQECAGNPLELATSIEVTVTD
jgi:hypothetical protein